PGWGKAKVPRAIAQERDVSPANVIGEFINDLPLLASDMFDIWSIIRRRADAILHPGFQQALKMSYSPASRGAPSDLSHQIERRFLAYNSKNVSQRSQSD